MYGYIRNGKISPWLLLNCKSGKELVSGFSDEQLELISSAFDFPFWIKRLKSSPADVALVKEICKEANIE